MEQPQVFISYHTNSSSHTVRQIAAALEEMGINCWYAPRNVDGDYASSIVRAINQCRVFLLILNKDSNLSEDVRNEINCAFERFRRHEDIVLLPFRMDDCTLSDAVQYYLGRIHIMDGSMPPQLLRLQELIDRVCSILGRTPEKTATVSDGVSGSRQYRLIGSMIYADNRFVGRSAELEHIHRVLTSRDNKLLLVGMGGIGKSEITKTYCSRFREQYDVILWVSFENSLLQTVINDFSFPVQGLERSDYPKDSDRDYFRRKVNILKTIADPRVLIVMDNFDVPSDPDLEEFCTISCSVLFTTRFRGISGHLQEIEISAITDEKELLELFQTEYQRTITSGSAVRELLQALDGHPLSIRLVASTMHSRRIPPEKMLALLKEGITGMKQRNAKAADIIYSRLQQVFSLAALSNAQLHLLKNLALLPLQGIPVETLYEWCDLDDFDVIDDLIRHNWVIQNPALDEVHLHPLVTQLMLEEVEKDPDCCNTLLESMAHKIDEIVFEKLSSRRLLMSCFTSVCERLPRQHPKRWHMLWGRAIAIFDTSAYAQALPMLSGLENQTDLLSDQLMVYSKRAHGYFLSGDPEKAIADAQAGLALVAGIPLHQLDRSEGCHVQTLKVRMCEVYQFLGDYDLAEKYAREALETSAVYYERTPQDAMGWRSFHLAKVLFKRARPEQMAECEQLFRKAMDLFRQFDDDLSICYCLMYIGQLHMRAGKFDDALAASRDAHGILTQYMELHHIDFAKLYAMEANIYRAMGDEEKALQSFAKAMDIINWNGHEPFRNHLEQIIASGEIGYLA